MKDNITVTLKNSTIGSTKKQQKTIEALGLKKIGQKVVCKDNDAIRGMIKIISHLVHVE